MDETGENTSCFCILINYLRSISELLFLLFFWKMCKQNSIVNQNPGYVPCIPFTNIYTEQVRMLFPAA